MISAPNGSMSSRLHRREIAFRCPHVWPFYIRRSETRERRLFLGLLRSLAGAETAVQRRALATARRDRQRCRRYTRNMSDIADAKRGKIPTFLTSPVAPAPANDFVEKPDHGAAYLKGLMIKSAERYLRRAQPFNLNTDANVVLGPAASGGDNTGQDEEPSELNSPVQDSSSPHSVDVDSPPPPTSLEAKADEASEGFREQLTEMGKRWSKVARSQFLIESSLIWCQP